ncbi:MAG: hypothetical protein J7J01_10750 [Methanophagales archaeon]|nr:hypothetical protein [Methanophagales archaeon]
MTEIEPFISEFAKRKGMDEEKIKRLWESINKEKDEDIERMKRYLTNVVDLAAIANEMPDGAKEEIMQKIPLLAMPPQSTTDTTGRFAKLAEDLLTFREMMRQFEKISGEDGSESEKEKLLEEIQKLERKIFEAEQDERFSELHEKLERLADTIEDLKRNDHHEEEKKDVVDSFLESLEEVEQKKRRFRELGLLQDEKEKQVPIEEAEKILRERGYKVERPRSVEEMEQFFEQRLQEKEEEIKKRIQEEEERKERRMQMMLDLGTTIVDGILSAAGAGAGGEAIQKFREAIRSATPTEEAK